MLETNLALELVRTTEAAALAAARTMGMGKAELTHKAAIDAMKHTLEQLSFEASIVLGEGEKGEVESLAHGLKIGKGGRKVELIVLPIDGPDACAIGGEYSLSVVAACEGGEFLRTPDIHFEKIAVGPVGKGVIDLNLSIEENLKRLAAAKKSYIEDLTVAILDRPRHTELIQEVRRIGARIRLIEGDVSGALATAVKDSGLDVLLGIGGGREGLLAASALSALGGDMQMRPKPINRHQQEALQKQGIHDSHKIFKLSELVSGDIYFAATGVTHSEFLEGVQFQSGGAVSHSFVVRSRSRTSRRIVSEHHFDLKPNY